MVGNKSVTQQSRYRFLIQKYYSIYQQKPLNIKKDETTKHYFLLIALTFFKMDVVVI